MRISTPMRIGNRWQMGSGVVVAQCNGKSLIMTNCHVVQSRAGIEKKVWVTINGKRVEGFPKYYSQRHDWATVVINSAPDVGDPIPLSSASVRTGSTVYTIGWGGGFKVRKARLNRMGSGIEFSPPPISGDSGGAVLSSSGRLIGLIAWKSYGHGGGPGISAFKATVEKRHEAFFKCRPLRPRPQVPVPPRQDDPVPPPPQVQPIDYGRIIDKLKSDPDFIAKIKGRDGRDGQDGRDGDDGKDGQGFSPNDVDYALIIAGVAQAIGQSPDLQDKLRGPAGRPGRDGKVPDNITIDINQVADAVLQRLPPVRMEIHHPDGRVDKQERPLGQPIKIGLIPVN